MKWCDSSGSPLESGHMLLVFRGMSGTASSWIVGKGDLDLDDGFVSVLFLRFSLHLFSPSKRSEAGGKATVMLMHSPVNPLLYTLSTQGGEEDLKVFERCPKVTSGQCMCWLVGHQGKERGVCIRTAFGLGSRISKVVPCTWEWLSLASPSHVTYIHGF